MEKEELAGTLETKEPKVDLKRIDQEGDLASSTTGIEISQESVNGMSNGSDHDIESIDQEKEGPSPVESSAKDDDQEQIQNDLEDNSADNTDKEPAIDFASYDKDALLERVVTLVREDNIENILAEISPIKNRFDELISEERSSALEKFIAEGGEKDDFVLQPSENDQKFFANHQLLRDRKKKYFKTLDREKDENLKAKNQILEELRELVDGEETITSIKVINEIRARWKGVGPIPKNQSRTLWANYNALLDRFYDNRSIHFELKELDRRKNLEQKIELCEKAEALAALDDINKAVKELNHLHEEFRHAGPIPLENQEEIWLRFKAASDTIYEERRSQYEEVRGQLEANLDKKLKLAEEMDQFVNFQSDRITEWNDKTKGVKDLQKRWESIGGIPRDKSKSINRKFWSGLKQFYANKTKFFKTLDGQREDNLKLKEALIEKANQLKESGDLNAAAEKIKRLQRDWREIGPVPDEVKNELYGRFKSICDEFFQKKREVVKEVEQEFEENLKRKLDICTQIEEISQSEKIDLDLIDTLQEQFAGIGFVPRKSINRINNRYDEVLALVIDHISDSDLENKDQVVMEIELRKMKGLPGSSKQKQRHQNQIRRQISTLENDIATWRNNLEFFSNSKTADKLKKEFDVKIEAANNELKKLKKQLKMMDDI